MPFLDVALKIVGISSPLILALLGSHFQARMTTATLMSQREQAESELRATMFGKLVDPIVRPQAKEVDLQRERLLAELLALNFHEHFELKPLLEDIDRRLGAQGVTGRGRKGTEDARDLLRSIATRVKDRQVALLGRREVRAEGVIERIWKGESRGESSSVLFTLIDGAVVEDEAREVVVIEAVGCPGSKRLTTEFPRKPDGVSYFVGHFTRVGDRKRSETFKVKSPDGKRFLTIGFSDPSWESREFGVEIAVHESQEEGHKFAVGWFDFPFTDNTLLADGNRFAVVIDKAEEFEPEEFKREGCRRVRTADLRLVWFPKDYFSPRERPINYREVRERLGVKVPE